MTHKRLFLPDITDEHLTLLHRAAIVSPDATAEDWIREIANGDLQLFEIPGGIIGLKFRWNRVYIELFAGQHLNTVASDIMGVIRALAKGRLVEGFVVDPRAVTVYKRFGFVPAGVYMRLEQ